MISDYERPVTSTRVNIQKMKEKKKPLIFE